MIVTFYSYKGGVGRSMALANIADQLARSGMRVLMVDFDLEAPGLEHFFPIEHERVRGREGLLDLLLAFKYAMSVAASSADEGEEDAYRDLDRYICNVYPRRSDGGRLDLLAAGLRQTDEQITRYGSELRRFDWQDFYYVWSGELFFEWFRRTCADRYDVVLVDSRTGVTELGGVCAYQLADAVVALCAPNLQNMEGTAWMVRHFLSPQVKAVRGDRPLEVLVVPSRVDQQDPGLLADFTERFARTFGRFTPPALDEAGLTFWELQVPYVPAYAFDEQVITDPGRTDDRRALVQAYDNLRNAIALLAPDRNPLAALRPTPDAVGREPVETRYDPTTRFATPDVSVSHSHTGRREADQIRELLTLPGNLRVAEPVVGQRWNTGIRPAKVNLVLVSPPGELSLRQLYELDVLAAVEARVLPVLLPGITRVPEELRGYACLDFRDGLDADRLLETVQAGLRQSKASSTFTEDADPAPYPGLMPFSESDAPVFFGRDELVAEVLNTLARHGTCTVIGESGSGKTSLVNAGVLPALRAGALPGSELWPIVRVHEDGRATELEAVLRSLADLPENSRKVVVVLDQFEELLTREPVGRSHPLDLLRTLMRARDSAFLPLTVLRTDFLVQARAHAVSFIKQGVHVTPMSPEELRQAVEMPARSVGLQLEPGLTDRLLADVGGEPGALPLLQSALHNMWTRRSEGYLTHDGYLDMGGVQGSLAIAAEEWFFSLSEDDAHRARELLLHLVSIGSDGEPLRRAVPTDTIAATGATDLCEQLLQRRLLVTRYLVEAGRPQVQLAHQALVDSWPRFHTWIQEAASALRLRQRLSEAATDWLLSGYAPEGLLSERSRAAVEDSITGRVVLGALEKRFLAASRADARRRRLAGRLTYVALLAVGVALGYFSYSEPMGSVLTLILGAGTAAAAALGRALTRLSGRERRSLTL
ncbi:nSTAND1 domain-containing NTPase [Streptomyces justiciae]|uniref:nSTAND1 domain-containing NTPase n=1 Tax=Streptomyces justiciae TaxID=2780140 RepID=UPI00187E642A|nr:AAA family ATPase [Streptomyces justiciae]MBE8474394.1 AAA family ATPase [Streptomyces justiciae]MCW8382876.1 AAA family ATPase [Streptomyces justiciae]